MRPSRRALPPLLALARQRVRPAAALIAACTACLWATPALAAKPLLRFRIDAHLSATVTREDAAHLAVRLSSGGPAQRLAVEYDDHDPDVPTHLETADYNFDGH